jgi:hypothetical protein
VGFPKLFDIIKKELEKLKQSRKFGFRQPRLHPGISPGIALTIVPYSEDSMQIGPGSYGKASIAAPFS